MEPQAFAAVAQVAHLGDFSKDVSGCSTTPYDISFLVRNEEAGGSNPLSSTRFQCYLCLRPLKRTYTIFEKRVVLVLPANERAGKSK